MSDFKKSVITSKGLALLAKAQAGATINFTKVAIGDGAYSGDLETLTSLKSHVKDLDISNLRTEGSKSWVEVNLNNSGMIAGYYIREIGLFAMDPDEGEILYSVSNVGFGTGDFIPSEGTNIVECQYVIAINTLNASEIVATMDTSLIYASKDEVEVIANGLGITQNDIISVSNRLEATESDLIGVSNTLATNQSNLNYVSDELVATQNSLNGVSNTLTVTQSELNGVSNTLDVTKSDLNGVSNILAATQNDLNPIIPTINNHVLSINTQSDQLKLTLKITRDITGGPIAIIRNGGVSKPLKMPNGDAVVELLVETMFYDVVEDNVAFYLAPKGAKLEGNALSTDVLLGKTFCNANDRGLIGTMDLSNLLASNIKKDVVINGVTGNVSTYQYATGTLNFAALSDGRNGYSSYGYPGFQPDIVIAFTEYFTNTISVATKTTCPIFPFDKMSNNDNDSSPIMYITIYTDQKFRIGMNLPSGVSCPIHKMRWLALKF